MYVIPHSKYINSLWGCKGIFPTMSWKFRSLRSILGSIRNNIPHNVMEIQISENNFGAFWGQSVIILIDNCMMTKNRLFDMDIKKRIILTSFKEYTP